MTSIYLYPSTSLFEEAGELLPDAGDIVAEGLLVQKVSFLGFHRRVANHSRCTSHQSNGFVSALLKMLENHNADHMSDVEGVGSRVTGVTVEFSSTGQ